MAHRHAGIGHHRIQQRERGDLQQQRRDANQPGDVEQRARPDQQRQRRHIGADGKARTEQQRAEAENRPVDQEAAHPTARLAHPPDGVEGLFDGQHHHQRGDHQKDHPHPGQLPRLLAERLQIGEQGRPGGGHEVAEDEALQLAAQLAERRHQRDHREGHRHGRHHREQRGVGERRGAVQAVVVQEAAKQEPPELRHVGQPLPHAVSLPNVPAPRKASRLRQPGRVEYPPPYVGSDLP